MTRHRCCAVFVVLFVMGAVRAEEPSWRCWCDPAIQRAAAAGAAPAKPAELSHDADTFFGETLEKTADRLHAEAVRIDDLVMYEPPWRGMVTYEFRPTDHTPATREQAADKFVTLLEQCPAYRHRDEIVHRLRDMATQWVDDAQKGKPEFGGVETPQFYGIWGRDRIALHTVWDGQEDREFVIPRHSPRERAEMVRQAQARARKVLETIEKTVSGKPLDEDTFRWDRKPKEFLEGWEWLEDVSLDIPGPEDRFTGFNVGDFVSGGPQCGAAYLRMVPGCSAQQRCRSSFYRQIMMRLQCETSPPARDVLSSFHHGPVQ